MTDRQQELIRAAGLRPQSVTVTGFADTCDGERAILTARVFTGAPPAFAVIREVEGVLPGPHRAGAFAVATLSAEFANILPTELERERLLAEGDADGGVGQAAVIRMIRERGKQPQAPSVGEVIDAPQVIELPTEEDAPGLAIPAELVEQAGGEGWGVGV